jgi:hypothetical protein
MSLRSLLSIATLACVAACSASADDGSEAGDGALNEGTRAWDANADTEFNKWIGAIGTARATGRCHNLNDCVNDPTINNLKAQSDTPLDIFADCADVPMELRAYFAVKTNRPFQYMSKIAGTGTDTGADERYSKDNHPVAWSSVTRSPSMQSLLKRVSDVVDSGFYRTAPEVVDTDTYPIDPTTTSLHAGSIFYDPNGHVLLVYKVDPDGTVWMIDGHPDNSLTYGPLVEGKFAVGGRAQGGGFRNYRPQEIVNGKIQYVPNERIHDFGDTQYGHGDQYVAWIRDRIATDRSTLGPDHMMNQALDQICVDLQARITAVAAGAQTAAGPLADMPDNIYAADGDWEAFSTPSRDARLRASFRGVYKIVKTADPSAIAKLGAVWNAHVAADNCKITYTNSAGAPVTITLADVQTRIYDLSFDPYHSAEMRWGAYPKVQGELASCTNCDAAHTQRFDAERRMRNVIDRTPVDKTGPDYGPDVPEDIDIPGLLHRLGFN